MIQKCNDATGRRHALQELLLQAELSSSRAKQQQQQPPPATKPSAAAVVTWICARMDAACAGMAPWRGTSSGYSHSTHGAGRAGDTPRVCG